MGEGERRRGKRKGWCNGKWVTENEEGEGRGKKF
jgi:hypothetical protein